MECNKGIYHSAHSNDSEQPSGDPTDTITKVQQTDCETAQDDGEVEPGEEGALVGKEDFGLDTGREGDALA